MGFELEDIGSTSVDSLGSERSSFPASPIDNFTACDDPVEYSNVDFEGVYNGWGYNSDYHRMSSGISGGEPSRAGEAPELVAHTNVRGRLNLVVSSGKPLGTGEVPESIVHDDAEGRVDPVVSIVEPVPRIGFIFGSLEIQSQVT